MHGFKFVYDILYDIFTDLARRRFKCCQTGPAQMQPDLNQMQALLVPNGPGPSGSHQAVSVRYGLFWHQNMIGLQWFITLYQASRRMNSHPPSPPSSSTSSPRPSWLGSCMSDFVASLYHSTSLYLIYPEYSASSSFFKTPTMTLACAAARAAAPQQVCGLRPPQGSRCQRNWPGSPRILHFVTA